MRKFFIFIFLILLSCQASEMKFDRKKWDVCLDGFCDYRESMINDLMENHLKKGMSINHLYDLLGKPNFRDTSQVGYDVYVDYGFDIDPIETKTLVFQLKDSIVVDYTLDHYKKE